MEPQVSMSYQRIPFWLQSLEVSHEELNAELQEGPQHLWSQLEPTRTDGQEPSGEGFVLGVRPSEVRARASVVGPDEVVTVWQWAR